MIRFTYGSQADFLGDAPEALPDDEFEWHNVLNANGMVIDYLKKL